MREGGEMNWLINNENDRIMAAIQEIDRAKDATEAGLAFEALMVYLWYHRHDGRFKEKQLEDWINFAEDRCYRKDFDTRSATQEVINKAMRVKSDIEQCLGESVKTSGSYKEQYAVKIPISGVGDKTYDLNIKSITDIARENIKSGTVWIFIAYRTEYSLNYGPVPIFEVLLRGEPNDDNGL